MLMTWAVSDALNILFLEANTDQLPLVARQIYLCFQARKSDESHLAPYPGLYVLLIGSLIDSCIIGRPIS